MPSRFDANALRTFAAAIFQAAGMPPEPAAAVAAGLVQADLYGHDTHGLALVSDYVEEIGSGAMAVAGERVVLSDFGAVTTWDARRLPGVWVAGLAIKEAANRADRFGMGAVAIRRSHHIACLAAFLEAPARQGKLVLLLSSDPSAAHVAPFGGRTPILTPNPIAAAIPATPDPIIIDVSTSITTAAMVGRAKAEGQRLAGQWLLDAEGAPTNDPAALGNGGTILPIGGLDHGHKGYALSLLVEALTQGLSGYGRADGPTEWGAAVFVLVLSPKAFGPLGDFTRQVDWLANACRASRPVSGGPAVRVPGDAALARKAHAGRDGVTVRDSIAADLRGLSARFGVPLPPQV